MRYAPKDFREYTPIMDLHDEAHRRQMYRRTVLYSYDPVLFMLEPNTDLIEHEFIFDESKTEFLKIIKEVEEGQILIALYGDLDLLEGADPDNAVPFSVELKVVQDVYPDMSRILFCHLRLSHLHTLPTRELLIHSRKKDSVRQGDRTLFMRNVGRNGSGGGIEVRRLDRPHAVYNMRTPVHHQHVS